MRILALCVAVCTFAGAAQAQAPEGAPPAPRLFASAADIQALVANARAKADGRPTFTQPIVLLPPYRANLEYRTSVGPAAVHENEAELFYVLDGSGTMVTGGKLIGETRPRANNLQGSGVEGGETRHVAKGDVIFVPEGSPHWFSKIDGTLVLMSMHVPRRAEN